MDTDAITRLTATALCEALRSGELTAADTVEAHIARIESVNGTLNAVVARRYGAAREEARLADDKRARGEPLPPLHGLPVSIKDSLDVTGLPSTFGVDTRAHHRAEDDETHVARWRAAGAIVLAKTNVAQCLMYTESENPLHGRTWNPWDPARTPGGSSGGEGALIAAGGSPLGLGTDIGGSVRVPAAFCGIASFKPTAGRMDDLGEFSVPQGQRAVPSQVGVLARSVADVALGLRVAATPAPHERSSLPPLQDERGVDLRTLRVGWYDDDGSFETAPAVKRAVREAAQALADAGASVVQWQPPDVPQALDVFYGLLSADGTAGLRRALAGSRRSRQLAQLLAVTALPRVVLPALRALLRAFGQVGQARALAGFGGADTDRYWSLAWQQYQYQREFAAALDTAPGGALDLVLAPAASLPAFTHGASTDLVTAGAYCALYNLLGYPAGVVPATRVRAGEESQRAASRDLLARLARRIEHDSAGLPIGVQVVARPWQEHHALAAMHALERAFRAQPDFPQTPVDPVEP